MTFDVLHLHKTTRQCDLFLFMFDTIIDRSTRRNQNVCSYLYL